MHHIITKASTDFSVFVFEIITSKHKFQNKIQQIVNNLYD